MPIKVITPEGDEVSHGTATGIFAADGALYVQSSLSNDMSDTVAIYAPGAWAWAKTPDSGV